MRRRLRLPLLGLALALLAGCGPSIATRAMRVSVDPEANERTPVAMDLVVVYDAEVVPLLLELTARQWFGAREQLLLDHPTGLRAHHWELVPGQELPAQRIPLPRDGAVAAFLYADYLAPGAHRVRVDPFARIRVRLTADELVVEPDDR